MPIHCALSSDRSERERQKTGLKQYALVARMVREKSVDLSLREGNRHVERDDYTSEND